VASGGERLLTAKKPESENFRLHFSSGMSEADVVRSTLSRLVSKLPQGECRRVVPNA